MKKIFFDKTKYRGGIPFWQPWGLWGCLWRFLLTVLLLLLLLYLLSLFRGCNRLPEEFEGDDPNRELVESPEQTDPDSPQPPGGGAGQNPPGGQSEQPVSSDNDWNRPIPGGEQRGLPPESENRLPPFDQTEPVPDPESDGAKQVYPNLLYVIFDSQADDNTFLTFSEKFVSLYPQPQHKISYYNTNTKTAVLEVPEARRMEICRNLPQQITEVQFMVVPVEVMTSGESDIPNDPVFDYPKYSWYFNKIQALDAWLITKGSPTVIVGIVDNYFNLSHEELTGDRILCPYSLIRQDSNVAPDAASLNESNAGHGTAVASVAVGNGNNSKGTIGIAPECKFIPVSQGTHLNTITMVEGLLYCMYHGADVINLSCGTVFNNQVERMSVDDQIELSKQLSLPQERMWDYVFKLAKERNVTIVWSAGNQNIFCALDESKRNDETIKVSAVDKRLRKSGFSNFGNFEDKDLHESTISAPGEGILGASVKKRYEVVGGTSFAAPIVAGAVALMKSIDRNLTTEEIIRILDATGKPVEGAPEIGKLIQIADALKMVKGQIADFVTDIDELKGIWETTTLLDVYNDSGEPTGYKTKIRLNIRSANDCEITYLKTNGADYKAEGRVTISNDKIEIRQLGNATSTQTDDSFVISNFVMKPDEERKMQCHIRNSLTENRSPIQCYLKKISQ